MGREAAEQELQGRAGKKSKGCAWRCAELERWVGISGPYDMVGLEPVLHQASATERERARAMKGCPRAKVLETPIRHRIELSRQALVPDMLRAVCHDLTPHGPKGRRGRSQRRGALTREMQAGATPRCHGMGVR